MCYWMPLKGSTQKQRDSNIVLITGKEAESTIVIHGTIRVNFRFNGWFVSSTHIDVPKIQILPRCYFKHCTHLNDGKFGEDKSICCLSVQKSIACDVKFKLVL